MSVTVLCRPKIARSVKTAAGPVRERRLELPRPLGHPILRTRTLREMAIGILVGRPSPGIPRAAMSPAASGGRTVEPITEEDF
jgi:hypothetical protein